MNRSESEMFIHADGWMEWVYLLLFLNHESKVKYSYYLMDGMSLFASLLNHKVKYSYSLMDGMSFVSLLNHLSESEMFILTDGWNEFIFT